MIKNFLKWLQSLSYEALICLLTLDGLLLLAVMKINYIPGLSFFIGLFGGLLLQMILDKKINQYVFEKEIQRLITMVRCYDSLEYGWNGYNAICPSPIAIGNAILFLNQSDKIKRIPHFVAPSPAESVIIEYKQGNYSIEFEFSDDGTTDYILWKKDNDDFIIEGDAGKMNQKELLDLFNYLEDGDTKMAKYRIKR